MAIRSLCQRIAECACAAPCPPVPEAGPGAYLPYGRAIRPFLLSILRERVMERSLEKFIEDQNIARYADQLKIESDPLRRKLLLELMAKEEANRPKHIQSKEK